MNNRKISIPRYIQIKKRQKKKNKNTYILNRLRRSAKNSKLKKTNKKDIYKTIDLCAGIGGIRRGFELTGRCENIASCEIDKYACITYEHIFGENPFGDVTSEEFKAKLESTNYDILAAGFPCQAFSRAGQQQGFLDEVRGTIFFDIADILKRTRPKAFLLENVDNLLSHKGGQTFKTILKVLIDDLEYDVVGATKDLAGNILFDRSSFIRNSRNFGIPQNRPRVYIVGFDKKRYNKNIDDIPDKSLPEKREVSIYQDLNDLIEYKAEKKYYLAQGYLDTLKQHKENHSKKGNGFGYEVVNKKDKKYLYSNAILATGGSGKERNLIYDYQDDIGGQMYGAKKTPLNHEGIRMMTPREWGKLQGFINYAFVEDGIDKFSFPNGISETQQYKQFGNSVTISTIEEMAKYIVRTLDYLEKRIR